MRTTVALTSNADPAGAVAELLQQLGPTTDSRRAVLLYATVQYDLPELCRRLQAALGERVKLVGCSTQGVVGPGTTSEVGFVAGAMAFDGADVKAEVASLEEMAKETGPKSEAMAEALRRGLGRDPQLVVALYDPLAGADVNLFIGALRARLGRGSLIGGAAGQPYGPMVATYQFIGDRVLTKGAVALALTGDFQVTSAQCSGAVPAGIEMTVTRAEGNVLLELDGQPALAVWLEMVGGEATTDVATTATWAVGVRRGDEPATEDGDPEHWSIVAAFAFAPERQGVILPVSVPEGTRVMFHHRTVEAVYDRTLEMGERVRRQLGHRRRLAVLGFECGGRTATFLGADKTQEENLALQRAIAPGAPWLGMIAWGEIADRRNGASFCNFTYPLAVLTAD